MPLLGTVRGAAAPGVGHADLRHAALDDVLDGRRAVDVRIWPLVIPVSVGFRMPSFCRKLLPSCWVVCSELEAICSTALMIWIGSPETKALGTPAESGPTPRPCRRAPWRPPVRHWSRARPDPSGPRTCPCPARGLRDGRGEPVGPTTAAQRQASAARSCARRRGGRSRPADRGTSSAPRSAPTPPHSGWFRRRRPLVGLLLGQSGRDSLLTCSYAHAADRS